MERYYRDAAIDNDMFTGLWDVITHDNWVLVHDIKSLTFMLVNYAFGESQMDRTPQSVPYSSL
jgi:hypothetical protein